LMGLAIRVAREERDELARETCRREVRGHHAEERVAVVHERGDTRRHRHVSGGQVSVRLRERVDETVEVEQVAHLALREDEHQEIFFSRPSACWFHGTRCVTPAAARPRFARYQSYVRMSASRFEKRGCQSSRRCAFETSTNESLCAVL